MQRCRRQFFSKVAYLDVNGKVPYLGYAVLFVGKVPYYVARSIVVISSYIF